MNPKKKLTDQNKLIKIDYETYNTKSKNFRQKFLILHYTAENFEKSVVSLTEGQVSIHYLVPTLKKVDPTYKLDYIQIYAIVKENLRAWHAGLSEWDGRVNLNDSSIGIEIVNTATTEKFQPFPAEQIEAVAMLCKNILVRYPDISAQNVLGHSDIAVGRKIDPGPLFPWKELYDQGIGAWYDEDTLNKYKKTFSKKLPSADEVVDKLHAYGYRHNGDTQVLFKTFQMHFRPKDYSGKLDVETAAAAYALADKYME